MLDYYTMFSLTSLIATMLVAQVSASAALTPLGVIHNLNRRQSDTPFDPNEIPLACKSQCALISDSLSRCQAKPSVGCDCNLADETAFVTCLNCILALTPSQALVDAAQTQVDEYVNTCASVGFTLPSTTLASAFASATRTAAGANTFTQSTFTPTSNPGPQPSNPTSDPVSSGDSGAGSGPLPGLKSAASRSEASVTVAVLTAAVYVVFF